jgi:hypothetical protein
LRPTPRAPAIKAPTAIVTKTDAVSFTGIYAVSVTDPSAGSGVQQLLIKDTGGTLTLGQTTGLTFVSGANNSMQMVVQGTLANLNAALATLTIRSPARAWAQAARPRSWELPRQRPTQRLA